MIKTRTGIYTTIDKSSDKFISKVANSYLVSNEFKKELYDTFIKLHDNIMVLELVSYKPRKIIEPYYKLYSDSFLTNKEVDDFTNYDSSYVDNEIFLQELDRVSLCMIISKHRFLRELGGN